MVTIAYTTMETMMNASRAIAGNHHNRRKTCVSEPVYLPIHPAAGITRDFPASLV
jgi:hypothetical protein